MSFKLREGYDDVQGILQTALVGVTSWTLREFRNTGLVFPHIKDGDIFSKTIQMPHTKELGTLLADFHIHYANMAAASGDIRFDYAWGWYNAHSTVPIPDTLPNTGSKTLTVAAADQYIPKIFDILKNTDITPPTPPVNEAYSSLFFITVTVVDVSFGAANELAIIYTDSHVRTRQIGSTNILTD